jgi:hypothetical protein
MNPGHADMMILGEGDHVDLFEEFSRIVDTLEAEGVEYALCGGMAVAVHGYPRFTKDIDLLVPADALDRLKTAVAALGYTEAAGPIPFDVGTPTEREIHRVSRIEPDGILTLDLLVVPSHLRDVWDTRRSFEWEGRRICAVSLEGLVQMKRLAGRRQDLLDIEKLDEAGGPSDE